MPPWNDRVGVAYNTAVHLTGPYDQIGVGKVFVTNKVECTYRGAGRRKPPAMERTIDRWREPGPRPAECAHAT